jgi:phospho-N-acetylmuramoyl-pentapeptide-transferase
MLYRFLVPLSAHFTPFNVFRYPSFRMLVSGILALLLGMFIGPWFIRELRVRQHGASNVREDTPEEHQKKVGTPTMGGGLVLFCVAIPTLVLADLGNRYVWFALLITLGFGAVGVADDYLKLSRKNSKGLSGRLKLIALTAIFVTTYLLFGSHLDTHVYVPFDRHLNPDLGLYYPLFAWLVVVGTANAVNITDGLDGLASGLSAIAFATFAIFAYIIGRVDYSRFLFMPYLQDSGELAVFCIAMVGALIGFLWYNTHPAKIFMGDTGSLALGGALGAVAILLKSEFVLAFVGAVFVAEMMSVIVQRYTFKFRKRRHGLEYAKAHRVFRRAPLHHHFEELGWSESQVVVRFWIIGILCAFFALSTIKLR